MLRKFLISICFSLLMIIMLTSCGSRLPFDPRLYNTSDSVSGFVPGEDLDIGDSNPFENFQDPDSPQMVENLQNWSFRATFASDNTPTFWYDTTLTGLYQLNNASENQYKESNAPNTSAQGVSISSVSYYRYDGMNPMFTSYSSYNTGTHGEGIARFLFYRFTGSAIGVGLDNSLVAIDTYTKLVFAYAEPTSLSSLGNPEGWKAIDHNYNGMYKFYEYDPAGIVCDDGTIELYNWYSSSMAKGIYAPSAPEDPTGRDVATYGQPGRSPYYSTVAEDTVDLFWSNIKGKTYNYRGSKGSSETLYKYVVSADGETITEYTQQWRESTEIPTGIVYTYDSYEGENKATYSGKTVLLGIDAITIDGKEVTIDDAGPYFEDRVKGLTFTGSGSTYVFDSTGDNVTVGSEKEPVQTNDNGDAFYQTDPGSKAFLGMGGKASKYIGMKLYTENGTIDDTLKFTSGEVEGSTPGTLANTTATPPDSVSDVTHNPAYLQ